MFWNSLDIRAPPTQLCNVSTGVFRQTDLEKIKNTVSSASITLKNLSQLHSEAALISRILYKEKTRLRHLQGLKKLGKVNRGLLKYLAFDLASVYTKFGKLLPECPEEFEFAVPSRQILEWVLVNTQGFAKLFCVIADTCEEAACYWKSNIRSGHLANVSLVILGVLGRIWSYAKHLVQNACNWFAELTPYVTILKLKGIAWLPQAYEIPKDLKTWLKSPHITNPTTGVKSLGDNTNKKRIFDLIRLEESMSDSEEPYIANDDFSPVKSGDEPPSRKKIKTESSTTHGKPLISSTEMDDFGEEIPRNVVKTKDNVWPLARSVDIEHFGEEVPRLDKKKSKKQRHECFSREDTDDNANSKSSKIVESELDITSEGGKAKKKKKKREKKRKRKHLVNPSEGVEMTNDTELPIEDEGNADEMHAETLTASEHEANPSESERKVTTSKRKRKKKSKLGLNTPWLNNELSLIDALLSTDNRKSKPSANNQHVKQHSKKKKKKGKKSTDH